MIQQTGSKLCADQVGRQIFELMERLYPTHRSQTGVGNRSTMDALSEIIPLEVFETPSGSKAFDWSIPKEWSIRDAHISFRGERLVDYNVSNLSILNGSQPVQGTFTFEELQDHLFVHDELADSIPYRTAFFRDQWGFCVTHAQHKLLEDLDGPFDVLIDASESAGSLTYAEANTNPAADQSFLIWAHCCHPSLANDNLSGLAVATFLAHELASHSTRYNYKFVFAPATIGAINWIAQQKDLSSISGGLVLSLLGDDRDFHFKKSRSEDSLVNKVFQLIESEDEFDVEIIDFEPFGYDERQFCSPATNLDVGRLTRALPGQFPEYHSSLDNLDIVSSDNLTQSFKVLLRAMEIFDANQLVINLKGNCEPFLQPYNLYQAFGEDQKSEVDHETVMWVLNLADGSNDLIDISIRSGKSFDQVYSATLALANAGVVQPLKEVS